MPSRASSRSPYAVFAVFMAVALVSTGALSWLVWQLVRQDAEVETQRRRERLEQADRAAAGMQRSLLEFQTLAGPESVPDDEMPPGVSVVSMDASGLRVRPAGSVPYLPRSTGRAAEAPAGWFAEGERLEAAGQKPDLQRALQTYASHANAADRAVRAAALVRIARVHRKLGNPTAALAAYDRLGAISVRSRPRPARRAHRPGGARRGPRSVRRRDRAAGRRGGAPAGSGRRELAARALRVRVQEVVDGDLAGAIRTYDAIISTHGADRSAVARALVAKAQCHEKLGHAEAQNNEKEGRFDLRLLKLDVPAGAAPRVLFDNPDVSWVGPYDWSPDGKSILVQLIRLDRTAQIGFDCTCGRLVHAAVSVDWRVSTRASRFSRPTGRRLRST